MTIGPVARILAQIIVPVVAVLARAIPAAYRQALNNAKKAGVDASKAAVPVFGKLISRSKALQVLNITLNKKANREQQQPGEQIAAVEEALDPILIKKVCMCVCVCLLCMYSFTKYNSYISTYIFVSFSTIQIQIHTPILFTTYIYIYIIVIHRDTRTHTHTHTHTW